VIAAVAFAVGALAQEASPSAPAPKEPEPPAAVSPAEPTPHLKVDMGAIVAKAVAEILAAPRFEEQVEVRDRFQESLNRYLAPSGTACGATASGPPPPDEMNRFRAHPTPPTADLLAGLKWLHRKVKGLSAQKLPRFFLYRVRSKSAPERFVYVVREGAVSENDRASAPGTEWELLTTFTDAGRAAETLTRLQRGLTVPSRPDEPRGTALWAVPPCPR